MNIAIIPARKGSKRIRNKNTKNFFGKPLVLYAIEAAKKSKIFDKIIISTDDKKIVNLALKENVRIHKLRPKKLSNDNTTLFDVIKYEISLLSSTTNNIKYLCCILPNPLINYINIKKSFYEIKSRKKDCVFSAGKYNYPIQRSLMIKNNGSVKFNFPKFSKYRSQDLKSSYHDAGQFYWWNYKIFQKFSSISDQYKSKRFPFIIPRHQLQDIDDREDWKLAEILYKNMKK